MALENILSQEIVQKLGWTLLHFVWQAAAVALLLTILLAVLRKSSANLRYIVACAALGLIVLLPIATMQMVPVSVPQPSASIEPAPAPVILPAKEIREIPAVEMTVQERPVQHENTGAAYKASWKQRAADLLEPALPYIVSAWLLGVFGLSLWHLGGWAQLQRLRKKMVKQVDAPLRETLRRLSQLMGVKHAVQLVESAIVQVPTVVGWLRPVILLPASALTGLSSEQLEALLAHELAHIRRYDYLVNMLQTVVETLGFYHPAVWWVSHKIRLERENCCDDLAVSISGDRIRYARALTSMEEIRGRRGELAVAAAGGNLFGRIRRLLGKEASDSSRASWIPSVITIFLIAVIVIPTTLALTTQNKTGHSAKSLLDKMLEHRSRVRNLEYVAEENIWRDLAAEQVRLEDHIKSMRESGMSERQLERFKKAFTEAPESRYQILKCTVDDEEHVKIEQTGGNYDSSGKKMPRDDKHIWAWNGVLATDFSQRSRLPASATIKDAPQVATTLGHPWRSFTGIFCKFLQETIAAEKPVSVEKLKDGTYRVAFDYKTSRYAANVDPSKGYTCVLQETYDEQGQLNSRTTAKYEEVARGIWFPVSGQREEYSPNGTVRYRSTSKSSQIRINDPAFNASYFDVDMPEGTAVTDDVQGKRYVVGSKRVYDLKERQKSIAETEEIDPNSWQEKFYSLYRLEDGQVLKRIAPPFIPERRGYLKSIQPGRYSPNTPLHVVSQYFNWDGKLGIRGARVGSGIPRLQSILGSVIGLGNRQYDIPSEILSADMSGDWIVRKDTPQEELLQALEQIVKNETSRDIDFVKQKVETEVIIAKGKYNFQLLPSITDGQYVLISTNNADTYTGGGGGSGTLDKFLRWVGNRVGMNVIDQTETEGVELSWRNHDSSELNRMNHDAEPYNQSLDSLLKNLNLQTDLTFKRETATVEKWFVSENGTIKAPQKIDASSVPEGAMLTLPTTDAENKTQQELLNNILEKFSDGTSADKSGNNSKSVRESVENYIAASLAGEDEKAAEYAYPESAVAQQTDDTREALQGRNISIVGICIGEWNSLAISSIIQADHGRTDSVVFHLKKMILDQKVNWLIDDIDLETLDTIGKQISYFLNNVPDAKTIIINPNTYANKHTDAKVESDKGRIEGKIIDINTGKGIPGVHLAAVPNSSPASDDRFSCTSGEDGAFAIGGLQSGEYLLQGDFPSVNVDVVSGRSTNDVLIGVDRRKAAAEPKETAAEQQGDVQVIIRMRMIELPADVMKDVFEPNDSLSSGLLIRHGHEIAGRLLTLRQEREDVKQMMNPQILMINNETSAMTLTNNEKVYTSGYESAEAEPGKLKAQIKILEAGWKYKIKPGIRENGEKVRIELAARQQKPVFETLQYRPGYDYQIPSPPEIFVTEMTAKNGEPVVIGRLRPGETAFCLIVTPSVLVPERLPEPLLGKKLPEPDNIQNIDSLKQAEGKRILICFWDMNQRPSRNIIVELAKRENELKARGITVFAVDTSQAEPAKLKQWLDSRKIPFACGNIENDAKEVLFRWGVQAQPWLILTDQNRVVRAEGFSIEQLDEKLQETSKPTTAGTRIVHFPKDRTVGDLKIRNSRPDLDWDRGYLSQPGWSLLGPAQGDVSIPTGEDLRLEVSGDVTDFSFLADLKPNDLQVLLLSGSKISDNELVHLKGLKGLIALSMDSTHIENEWLAHIATLTSLKELSLFDTQVSDVGLEHLSALKSLKRLNLFVTKVRGPGLKHLKNLTSLVSLDLAATPITDASLEHVAEMTWLKELQLQDTDITDEGLAHLKSLRSLEMLVLGNAGLKQGYSPITDNGLVHLKGLDSLKYLHLLRTRVTGIGLVHLRNLKALKTVKIAELRLKAKDLEYLEETAGLRDLQQDGEDISEVDVKNIEMALSGRKISVEAGRINMRSAAPSGADKSIVKVDLSVVEVSPDSKMDTETIIAIENLLGGKITIPDSPAVADLLRKAAKATASIEDESATDKRVTQEQFDTLFDLLVSRGYVKILMNPTLQVVESQTAQIKTDRNSLEVTANAVKDNLIYLTVKADLSSKLVPEGEGQKPIISTRSFANFVRISSGQSQIIGGMILPAARLDADGTAKISQTPAGELMCIVTASIIAPAADEAQQNSQITFSGRCRDSGGRPLSNAHVLFFCRDFGLGSMITVAQSQTNSEGHFTLGPITPPSEKDWGQKSYLVFVPADGHGPAWKTVDLYKPNKEPLEITAYDSAVITGSIITEDSEPVAGAQVWVRGIISPEATEDPASRTKDLHTISALPGWSVVTKQDGSFRIPGVPDGARIRLSISHQDFAECFVHVKPGTDAKIKVQPAAAIAGRVLYGNTGKPAVGVTVQAQGIGIVSIPGGNIMPWTQTITDEQGRYQLESMYGTRYNIWAKAENLTVVALESFQAVAGETREAPDLVLIEGGFITGRVIDESTGKPIKPGQYSDVGIYGPSRPKSGAAIEHSNIREDGSFRIRVAPGRNYIYLRPMNDWIRGKAIVSPPSLWVNVASGQTVEVEFKVRKLTKEELEAETERRQKETIKYLVPKTLDEVEKHGKEAKEPLADKPMTRVYDISDLVGATISRGTVDSMMDGSGGMMGGHVNIPDQAIVNEAQNIVNLIIQTIDPNSWYENDPNAKGIISPYPVARPRKLAIYQTLPAHQQIEKLLESRREQIDTTQISIGLRYLYTNVEFLDEVRDSMDIEFTSDTFLDDKQLETLLRASQKKRDIRSLMAPGVTVLNNETARFNTVRQSFMSFLDYSEPNNVSQQSPPVPIHTFCRITPHIEDNKDIMIDFVQDIPGLQERIIYDRHEMVQSYTETTAITNKRIPNNKTFAFTCDIIKFDQDNQTASPAEKKTLIVLIKPTIIVQEEMPRSDAAAMILNSLRSEGYTAEQADETIYHKPLPEEQPGIGKDQMLIDTKILTVSDAFLKYIGLDPNSVASSKGWSDYLVHSTDDSASFVIDQLHADLILLSVAAHKDIQMLVKPQILAMAGKKVEIHILKPDSYILRSPGEPNALSGESESKSNSIELGTTVRLLPNLTPDRKNVELDFEWEYRRLRGFKEHTGPDGNVQKVPIVDTDRIKTPCTVPDGKTLLIAGKKIPEQNKKEPKKPGLADLPLIGGLFKSPAKTGETGNLLILIKPSINPPKKAPPKQQPIDPNDPLMQPIDPNDPLIKQLEEKFKRSAEQQ